MLATTGFHHVTMVSSDAARTLRFYRDVLGFGLVKRTVNYDDPSMWHLYLGDETTGGAPGTLLTFFESRGAAPGRPGAGGVHHVALGVATPAAQLMWKRWLEDRGVSVSGPYDRGWFRSIYFADPDGQILEIATAGPGYAVDEAPDALGTGVVVPPTAELRGARDEIEIRSRSHPEPVPAITTGMRLSGIHHISGLTDDVAEMGEFYEAALGLRLVKRSVNQDDPSMPHWFWASYDGVAVAPHSSLTMFGGWAAGGARLHGRLHRVRAGAGQTHHIAFRARDAAELEGWLDRLDGLGVKTSGIMDRTYFSSIYFRAPDGLLFEIATDGPGFALDEPPGRLGQRLMLPRWLEERRSELEAGLHPLSEAHS
jgi:glyoxalase family protein